MAFLNLKLRNAADIPTPSEDPDRSVLFFDESTGLPAVKDSTGAVISLKGEKGDDGDKGDSGEGVPPGGSFGQALVKASGTDYDVTWGDGGGGGGGGETEFYADFSSDTSGDYNVTGSIAFGGGSMSTSTTNSTAIVDGLALGDVRVVAKLPRTDKFYPTILLRHASPTYHLAVQYDCTLDTMYLLRVNGGSYSILDQDSVSSPSFGSNVWMVAAFTGSRLHGSIYTADPDTNPTQVAASKKSILIPETYALFGPRAKRGVGFLFGIGSPAPSTSVDSLRITGI